MQSYCRHEVNGSKSVQIRLRIAKFLLENALMCLWSVLCFWLWTVARGSIGLNPDLIHQPKLQLQIDDEIASKLKHQISPQIAAFMEVKGLIFGGGMNLRGDDEKGYS